MWRRAAREAKDREDQMRLFSLSVMAGLFSQHCTLQGSLRHLQPGQLCSPGFFFSSVMPLSVKAVYSDCQHFLADQLACSIPAMHHGLSVVLRPWWPSSFCRPCRWSLRGLMPSPCGSPRLASSGSRESQDLSELTRKPHSDMSSVTRCGAMQS